MQRNIVVPLKHIVRSFFADELLFVEAGLDISVLMIYLSTAMLFDFLLKRKKKTLYLLHTACSIDTLYVHTTLLSTAFLSEYVKISSLCRNVFKNKKSCK